MYQYYQQEENDNTPIIFAVIVIGILIYLHQSKNKEPDIQPEKDSDTFYKWEILNPDILFKYIDITTDDRIEGIKTNGYVESPGSYFIRGNEFISHGRYHNEATSITGCYNPASNSIELHISLKNMAIDKYVGGKWEPANLKGRMVSVGVDGEVIYIREDKKVYHTYVNGEDHEFSFINSAGGFLNVCAVKKDGRIYRLSNTTRMVRIFSNIKFKQASIGTDGSIFGIDINNDLYKLESNDEWDKLNKKAKMVTHYQEDTIYIINMDDKLEQGTEI